MTDDGRFSRGTYVNSRGLNERVLLEAEIMRCHTQLRDFANIKDRLRLTGHDADAEYRRIDARRQQLTTELGALLSPPRPAPVRPRVADSPLSFPVVPASFNPSTGALSFGFSGSVQLGRAQERDVLVPEDAKGSITTLWLSDDSTINFAGDLDSTPAVSQLPRESFWLHSWTYLVAFPAPAQRSTLTYSLKIGVEVAGVSVSTAAGSSATFWSFIALGETPNFSGQEIGVSTPAGWPLIVSWPDAPSEFIGQSTVQRSLVVEGNQTPAVALVVGAVLALGSGAEMHFDPGGACLFLLGANTPPHGYIKVGVVDFHYDPPQTYA